MSQYQLPTLFYELGKMAGIIGFVCLSFLIISGDTARFFDRYFGLDKIIKFQRKFSLITAVFVILHPLFFIFSDNSIAVYLLPNFTFLSLALGAISLYIFISVMIASFLYKRISHLVWQYIHILTYVLFFFSLYHAFNWGSDSSLWYIKILYAILFFGIVAGIIYRTQYKIRKYFSGKFYVQKIIWETRDTFSLILTAPKNFRFNAGQFCFLRLNKNNLYARHPFTISSSPHEQNLKFTIKNTGRFTVAASNLKPGEQVFVDGPFGIFTLRENIQNFVFIAGGVGITPFASMINYNRFSKEKRNIILFYCSKTEKDIIFKNEFDDILEDWFKKIYILSNINSPSKMGDYEIGYLNKKIIKKYVEDINNWLFYICGPEHMKDGLKKTLTEMGIKKRNIIVEDFFW